MDIKEIALKVAQSTNLHYIVTSEIPTNDDWNIRFAEALISAHKAELLKGVGEPVAYYDPDLDCGSAGISFDPLSDGIGLYTSDQVAAAVGFAEALIAEIAKQNEPIYAFRRKGLDYFCTCDKRRFDELSQKPALFEVQVFYRSPPTAEQIANETAWQPIETAPVLSNVLAARLDYGQVCWVTDARKSKVGFWSTINGRAVNEPTHWMPLPKAPNGASS